jgi:hypothetical protein
MLLWGKWAMTGNAQETTRVSFIHLATLAVAANITFAHII